MKESNFWAYLIFINFGYRFFWDTRYILYLFTHWFNLGLCIYSSKLKAQDETTSPVIGGTQEPFDFSSGKDVEIN